MVRLDDEQSAELDRLADVVGVAGSTLAHNAVMAIPASAPAITAGTVPMT